MCWIGPAKRDANREDRATTLQLREFMKAIDRKELERAGISDEKWLEFLRNYSRLAKQEDTSDRETPDAPVKAALVPKA